MTAWKLTALAPRRVIEGALIAGYAMLNRSYSLMAEAPDATLDALIAFLG